MRKYFLLNYLLTFCFVAFSSTEPNLKSKIDKMFDSKDLTSAPKMCKLKHDLNEICRDDTMMKLQTNCKDIQEAIDYLSSRLDEFGVNCVDFKNQVEQESNTTLLDIQTSLHFDALQSKNVTSFSLEINKTNDTDYPWFDVYPRKDLFYDDDDEALDMYDYLESLSSEASTDQILCEDCQMDYDDETVIDFNQGMTIDEDSGDGGTNKIVVFFSCVGIGLVLLIVAVAVVAHFGIKKLKEYLNNRNLSSSPRMNGYGNESYEMT